MFTEYFLEDCIQMTHFVPPPSDRKRKDKDEEGGEDEVCEIISSPSEPGYLIISDLLNIECTSGI